MIKILALDIFHKNMASVEVKTCTEEFQCHNKSCSNNWIDTISLEEAKKRFYRVRLCSTCCDEGYSVRLCSTCCDDIGQGWISLIQDKEIVDGYTLLEATKNNPPYFVPREHTFQCYNKSCPNNWTETIHKVVSIITGYQVCSSCKEEEYSVELGYSKIILSKNKEKIDEYSLDEAVVLNSPVPKEKFEPYLQEYQCGNKSCSNNWNDNVFEKPPMKICGGHARVCPPCEKERLSVYDGVGDGKFYLYKNGQSIDVYSREEAYKLNKAIEKFQPYRTEYTCKNKDCNNKWSRIVERPPPVIICGNDDRMCSTCETVKL